MGKFNVESVRSIDRLDSLIEGIKDNSIKLGICRAKYPESSKLHAIGNFTDIQYKIALSMREIGVNAESRFGKNLYVAPILIDNIHFLMMATDSSSFESLDDINDSFFSISMSDNAGSSCYGTGGHSSLLNLARDSFRSVIVGSNINGAIEFLMAINANNNYHKIEITDKISKKLNKIFPNNFLQDNLNNIFLTPINYHIEDKIFSKEHISMINVEMGEKLTNNISIHVCRQVLSVSNPMGGNITWSSVPPYKITNDLYSYALDKLEKNDVWIKFSKSRSEENIMIRCDVSVVPKLFPNFYNLESHSQVVRSQNYITKHLQHDRLIEKSVGGSVEWAPFNASSINVFLNDLSKYGQYASRFVDQPVLISIDMISNFMGKLDLAHKHKSSLKYTNGLDTKKVCELLKNRGCDVDYELVKGNGRCYPEIVFDIYISNIKDIRDGENCKIPVNFGNICENIEVGNTFSMNTYKIGRNIVNSIAEGIGDLITDKEKKFFIDLFGDPQKEPFKIDLQDNDEMDKGRNFELYHIESKTVIKNISAKTLQFDGKQELYKFGPCSLRDVATGIEQDLRDFVIVQPRSGYNIIIFPDNPKLCHITIEKLHRDMGNGKNKYITCKDYETGDIPFRQMYLKRFNKTYSVLILQGIKRNHNIGGKSTGANKEGEVAVKIQVFDSNYPSFPDDKNPHNQLVINGRYTFSKLYEHECYDKKEKKLLKRIYNGAVFAGSFAMKENERYLIPSNWKEDSSNDAIKCLSREIGEPERFAAVIAQSAVWTIFQNDLQRILNYRKEENSRKDKIATATAADDQKMLERLKIQSKLAKIEKNKDLEDIEERYVKFEKDTFENKNSFSKIAVNVNV
jgi:hypothetical protein